MQFRVGIVVFIILVCALDFLGCRHLENSPINTATSTENLQATIVPDDEKSIVEHTFPKRPILATTAAKTSFHIGKDDRLEVSVYTHDNLKIEQRVRPDGKIAFPLVGEIEARGRTPRELQEELESRLAKFIRNPRVTVIITEYNSRKAIILGEVAKPGSLRLISDINLLEGISQAGGVTEAADLQGTMFVRNGQVLPVNFNRLLRSGDLRHNIRLQDKDIILIPSISARKVFVLGEVKNPRVVTLKEEVTLVEAILEAGGFSPGAKTANILVIRGGLGSSKVLQVNLQAMLKQGAIAENLLLQPHDIVYVPQTVVANALEFFQVLTTVLTPIVLAETGISIGPIVKSVLTTGTRGEEQSIVVTP